MTTETPIPAQEPVAKAAPKPLETTVKPKGTPSWLPADAPEELKAFVGDRTAVQVAQSLMHAQKLIGRKGMRPAAGEGDEAWSSYHGVPEGSAYEIPLSDVQAAHLEPADIERLKSIFASAYLSQSQANRLMDGLYAFIKDHDEDEARVDAELQNHGKAVRETLGQVWGAKAPQMAEHAKRGLRQLFGQNAGDMAHLLTNPLNAETQAELMHGMALMGIALGDGGPAVPMGAAPAPAGGDAASQLRAFRDNPDHMAAYRRWEPWAVERVNQLQNNLAG